MEATVFVASHTTIYMNMDGHDDSSGHSWANYRL